jgi:Tfp pilus assembly ATPase PilU
MYVCDYCHPTNGETMDDKSYIAALENTVKKMEDTLDYIVSVRNERIEKLDIALNKIEEDLSHTMIFSDPMAYVHSVARCAVIASEALRGGDGA